MKLYIYILISLLFICRVDAQNSDSIFRIAREEAYNKKYKEALNKLEYLINKDSSRTDVLSFIASIYSWRGQYDIATEYIHKSLSIKPTDTQVVPVWLNILYWQKEYNKLLTACDYFQYRGYDNHLNLILMRADAYEKTDRYREALTILRDSSNGPLNYSSEIVEKIKAVKYEKSKFGISLNYSINTFDSLAPQHFLYGELSFKVGKNSFVTRINYNQRFGKTGFMGEIDYYRKFGGGWYIYMNYGQRLSKYLFPDKRLGYELYLPSVKSIAVSIGGRHLFFEDKNIFIATGSISIYGSKYWIAARPFISFKDEGTSFSYNLSCRRYIKNAKNYWGVEASYGNSPDDRLNIQSEANFRLLSYKAKAELNLMITTLTSINFSFGYNYEEYFSDKYRNRYIFEMGYKIKL